MSVLRFGPEQSSQTVNGEEELPPFYNVEFQYPFQRCFLTNRACEREPVGDGEKVGLQNVASVRTRTLGSADRVVYNMSGRVRVQNEVKQSILVLHCATGAHEALILEGGRIGLPANEAWRHDFLNFCGQKQEIDRELGIRRHVDPGFWQAWWACREVFKIQLLQTAATGLGPGMPRAAVQLNPLTYSFDYYFEDTSSQAASAPDRDGVRWLPFKERLENLTIELAVWRVLASRNADLNADLLSSEDRYTHQTDQLDRAVEEDDDMQVDPNLWGADEGFFERSGVKSRGLRSRASDVFSL
jgi:hypothetical protein